MPSYTDKKDAISRDIAEVSFKDLETSPGVIEVLQLYEAAMAAYSAAQSQISSTITISSTSSAGKYMPAT